MSVYVTVQYIKITTVDRGDFVLFLTFMTAQNKAVSRNCSHNDISQYDISHYDISHYDIQDNIVLL